MPLRSCPVARAAAGFATKADAPTHPSALTFPFATPPAPGAWSTSRPGIRWLRLPLPYRLDHVNIYLIENDGGWTALDTGLGTDACKQAWDAALGGPAEGARG